MSKYLEQSNSARVNLFDSDGGITIISNISDNGALNRCIAYQGLKNFKDKVNAKSQATKGSSNSTGTG